MGLRRGRVMLKNARARFIKNTFFAALFILVIIIVGVFPLHKEKDDADNTESLLHLVKPAFGLESEISFLEEEAGISMYTYFNQPLDLSKAKSAFKIPEKEGSTYVIGTVSLPGLPETDDVHCYVKRDGLVAIYYLKEEPVSKIIDWNYYTAEGLTRTKLQTGLRKVCNTMGVTATAMGYYHFQYPDSNKLMIITEMQKGEGTWQRDVWTGSWEGKDSFKLKIPSELIIYERSWSQHAGKGTVMKYGLFSEMQLSPNMFHTIDAIGTYNYDSMWGDSSENSFLKVDGETISHIQDSRASEVAIALLYRETSASEVSTRILVEYADSIFTVSLEHPSLFKLSSSLTISSSATSISFNETITVSGGIFPPLAGITLTLTYTKPDGTLLARTVVTKSDGGYADAFKLDQTGRWEVKTSWIGDENYYGAKSSPIYFEVTPIIFNLTIQTPYEDIIIEINSKKYITNADGKVEVEVSSDFNVVNVKAQPQVLEADFRAIFTGWSDGETSNQRTLTINRNTILIANYNIQYYLEVKTNPLVILDVSGSGWYDAGSTATIEPPPTLIEDKYEFREWLVNGESVGDKLPTIITNKPYTITLVYYHVESIEIQLPSGESTSTSAATSSKITKLIHTPSERKLTISIEEQLENGTIEILMPQALLMEYDSSTENLMARVSGETKDFSVKPHGDDYLLTITYPSGQFQVDIYYITYEFKVNVKSRLLKQPIKDVSIQILWSDENLFKSGVTDSRGIARFNKLPTANYIVTAEHQGQLFSELKEWEEVLDQTKSLELSFFTLIDLYVLLIIFLIPASTMGVIHLKVLKPRGELIRETEKQLRQLIEKYRKETGGLALLSRVYLDLEKSGLESLKYVEKALTNLEKKGQINGIVIYGRLKTVEFVTPKFTEDQKVVLRLASESDGKITREEIVMRTGWNIDRTEGVLKEFERQGIARREVTNGKHVWIFEGLKGVKPEKKSEY